MVISYAPITDDNYFLVAGRLAYAKSPGFKNFQQKYQWSIEQITINNRPAVYEIFPNGNHPYSKALGFETDHITIDLRVYPPCDITEEDLIKIAKSMK